MQLLYKNTNGFTAAQLADHVGIRRQAFSKRPGVSDFLIGLENSGNGRPVKLYSADALKLWSVDPKTIEEIKSKKYRKGRTDKGIARSMSHDTWLVGVKLVKELYLNQAIDNVQLCCEEAEKRLVDAGYSDVSAKQLYARIMRNEPKRNMYGPFFSDPEGNWKAIRNSRLRVNATKLSAATARYNLFAMLENAGMAGDGFGAGRIIVIDDFKRDSWTLKDGKLHMPGGVGFIDALTRKPLLLLPTETITTNVVAVGILTVVNRYGLLPDTVWVMENSKAMKNINVEQLVRTLYHPQEIADFHNGKHTWIKNLFGGQKGPIVRNLPHIARFLGKAMIERFFKIVKDEFDATRFALNYQGGNRLESVHLTVNAAPLMVGQDKNELPVGMYTTETAKYWDVLFTWIENDCVNRVRKVMYSGLRELHGVTAPCTIQSVWERYTGGANDKREIPSLDNERLARLLYFAQPERHKFLVTLRNAGHYQTSINNRNINIVHPALTSNYIGRKLATIAVPTQKNRYLVLVVNNDTQIPDFLCVAEDMTAHTIEEASSMRASVKHTRESIEAKHKTANRMLAVWETKGIHEHKQNDGWIPNLVANENKELTGMIYETYEAEEYSEPEIKKLPKPKKQISRAEKLIRESENLLKNCSNY